MQKRKNKKSYLIYDAINKILNKNKILAPNYISENYIKNYIEIQDFGDETFLNFKKKKIINKFLFLKR